MRAFKEFLTESEKKYMFRVRVACDVTADLMDKLKAALQKYGLDDVSSPKRLPITQKAFGFEHLNSPEVYILDVVTNYPCSPLELVSVFNSVGIPSSLIVVTTPNQEILIAPIASEAGEGEAVLDKELPKNTYPQILADLESAVARKEASKYQYKYEVKPPKGHTTNELPQGKTSPIGTKQNKIPNPYKR